MLILGIVPKLNSSTGERGSAHATEEKSVVRSVGTHAFTLSDMSMDTWARESRHTRGKL